MWKVRKRDNSLTEFEVDKIKVAIKKAFHGSKKRVPSSVLDLIAIRAVADFEDKIADDVISVEDIQDSVEHVLAECGYSEVAKAYILYRREHERLREIEEANHQYLKDIERYLEGNQENTIGGLILNNSASLTELYWLEDIYDRSIREAVHKGTLEIGGMEMMAPYACIWDLNLLLKKGILPVQGKVGTLPAKHLSTACSHITNFIGIIQNEWVSVQGFEHIDTLLAPFVRQDELSYAEIKQSIQTLVYGLNVPSRWGGKAPFSHFAFDGRIPEKFIHQEVFIAGKKMTFVYGDLEKEAGKIRQAFYEVLLEGDGEGKPFAYPWITVNYLEEKVLDLLKKDQCLFWRTMPQDVDSQMISGKVSISFDKETWKEKLTLAHKALLTQQIILDKLTENGLYPYSKAYGLPDKKIAKICWKNVSLEQATDLIELLQEEKEVLEKEGIYMEFIPEKEIDIMKGFALQEKTQSLDGLGKLQSIDLPEEMSDKDILHYLSKIQKTYHLRLLGFHLK
ncbi:anaerobic ribonucleoside-triphosphate reductase [Bulleidia sp. zg-1006]|uniref:anaerobic ribonucleoside-triphosphate reductase n=1 Tax=Bulleidia sp. zg-1006 TaxID=2806552 RepID=UPI001939EFCD|nr:anaerobic ribonucleoside-triphosphate reductase [Bulleidia sp. zg-1006]QRG87012.1 hypothetical protein JOS54_01495 [Bulleidia sp. zg-1006]